MSSPSSDLYLFATTLAEHLGWTATLVPGTQRIGLKASNPPLSDAEIPAALLTMPDGTQFIATAAAEPGAYSIVPRLPDDLPAEAVFEASPHKPATVLVVLADQLPRTAGLVEHFAREWEDHLFLLRNPGEAVRRGQAFTAYTGSIAEVLPGDWATAPVPLRPFDRDLLGDRLWTSGSDDATALSRRAARASLLSGPDHDVVLLQEAGSRALIIAATLLPTTPFISQSDAIPGPGPLVLPSDPHEAADRIYHTLLPVWTRNVWDARISLLAHATVELHHTAASWQVVSPTYAGHPLAEAARGTAMSLRDVRAQDAVDVYLAHAPALLDGITAVTTPTDHLAGPLRGVLYELDYVRQHLTGITRIRQALSEIQEAPATAQSFLTLEHAQDAWHHAMGLATAGDTMIRAARHVAPRIGTPPPPPPTPVAARKPAPEPTPQAPCSGASSRRGR
ncbi:hypothetical protein [Streptomyces acidiscabies]|uniref:Uncharacterized protein n=1 Tax=Streptomyces acidiscabies TaxID=42234 RepID=A0AAP6BJ16_9ACTN|nr:hypothetical protein [Streptomyces acidiscabies]MBP5935416.1 hypothetical protein [Streptomyces sp. LBUM 1476]MBZ3916729.1 hypothetical protein [Streptomyces acidiscabies]MDX2965634.1 hypothetical protein [Streptomyces acidiscabies]MDX3024864.1 hypothetical protein [Streptomyces acidiscabies]MDX3795550.1 hypothetical protein [Streptomyces acidiscabies]